jgi:hypothetical protein
LQRFLFFLLLVSCSQEYGITDRKTTPSVDVSVDTADTGRPPLVVDIPETGDTGEELVPLIHVDPYDYDFGEVQINCSESYDVTISSVGTAPLVIEDLYYITSPDLSMTFDHKLPLVLDPGEETIISFEYSEDDLFEDSGKLYIYSNALGKPEQRVNHYGQGVAAGSQIDVFEQEEINKADILFVVDNSCSMTEEQDDLSSNAENFVNTLISNGIDFQISVITTDSASPVISMITSDRLDAGIVLSNAVRVGTGGSFSEQGQERAMEALGPTGALSPGRFQREDATLSVVVVSDEDDSSPLANLEYYDFFMTLKDPEMFLFHSVVGIPKEGTGTGPAPVCSSADGDRYIDQSSVTDGVVLDICGPWGTSLTTLANPVYIVETIYPLTKEAIKSSVEVFLDGYEVDYGWDYDEVTNSVIFTDSSMIVGDELLQIIYDYVEECS